MEGNEIEKGFSEEPENIPDVAKGGNESEKLVREGSSEKVNGRQGNELVEINTDNSIRSNGKEADSLNEGKLEAGLGETSGGVIQIEVYAGRECVVVKKRGNYKWKEGDLEKEAPLPDIVFPKEFLGQKPMKPDDLIKAAEWFVYEIDEKGNVVKDELGRPKYNQFFSHLKKITEEKNYPLVRALSSLAKSKFVGGLMERMGVYYPYYQSEAMLEIAKLAFSREIKPEYKSSGSQYFYEVIGPVYDFFHQMNTQAIPQFSEGEFKQIDGLPLALISKEKYSKETEYYPNDAVGRDGVAAEIAEKISGGSKILAVGDGPIMTSLKIAEKFLNSGKRNLQIDVLEYNKEQIENGKRNFESLPSDVKRKLEEAGIKINWIQADASKMPFPDESFDLVFSTYVVGAMGGKVHGPQIVEGYAKESARVLKPGGEHITLDFYLDGKYMGEGFGKTNNPEQKRARKAYKLLKRFIDGPLKNCYEGIWDHITTLNDTLIDASLKNRLIWEREHRQTWFGHIPLFKVGNRVLALSVPGYNEMKNVFKKNPT